MPQLPICSTAYALVSLPLARSCLTKYPYSKDSPGYFEQVDSVWWYQGHAWCLDRIGKVDEGLSVIQAAIQHAPHDNFREHAERVLQLRLNEC